MTFQYAGENYVVPLDCTRNRTHLGRGVKIRDGWGTTAELVKVAGTLHLTKALLGSGGLGVKHPGCEFDFGTLDLTMKARESWRSR